MEHCQYGYAPKIAPECDRCKTGAKVNRLATGLGLLRYTLLLFESSNTRNEHFGFQLDKS